MECAFLVNFAIYHCYNVAQDFVVSEVKNVQNLILGELDERIHCWKVEVHHLGLYTLLPRHMLEGVYCRIDVCIVRLGIWSRWIDIELVPELSLFIPPIWAQVVLFLVTLKIVAPVV